MAPLSLKEDTPLFCALNKDERGDNVSQCLTCGMCSSRCSWFDGAQRFDGLFLL